MASGKKKFPTQKGNAVMDLTEDQARAYVEKMLWPDGQPVCRKCGSTNAYKMVGKTCRPGLCRCRDCRKQFTVTVGTIFEDSHLPLATWVKAIHMMTSAKKGVSALQLQRNLGLGSYKTAWFLAHRIRLAMRLEPVAGMLKGAVQCDETYIGADRTKVHHVPKGEQPRKRGRGTDKTAVFALVETGGRAYSCPVAHVDGNTLKAHMEKAIHPSATIVTDELASYPKAAAGFAGHETVKHRAEQYKNERGYHTNDVESYFALLKRGVIGAFHHVSPKHLHRYCDEFSFRWSERSVSDAERRELALKGVEGKRLMFKTPVQSDNVEKPVQT